MNDSERINILCDTIDSLKDRLSDAEYSVYELRHLLKSVTGLVKDEDLLADIDEALWRADNI